MNKQARNRWLLYSTALFAILTVISLTLVMLLNGSMVNRVFSPLTDFLPMFHLIRQEQPFGALWFISDKSLFALAHLDARSGLNHWTLEFNALSLLGYVAAALLGGRILTRQAQHLDAGLLGRLTAALAGVALSVTYVTSVAHCSGPTWAGFVALYGLGIEGFETALYWQFLLGLPSLAALVYWASRPRQGEL